MLPLILEPSSPRFQSSRVVLAQVLTDDRKIEGARSLMDAEDLLVGRLARSAVSSAEAERMLTHLIAHNLFLAVPVFAAFVIWHYWTAWPISRPSRSFSVHRV
jgi:hypothetical protein